TYGRIYRSEYQGYTGYPKFDLTKWDTIDLCNALKYANTWYRRMARQQLIVSKHSDATKFLTNFIDGEDEQLALEALLTSNWRGETRATDVRSTWPPSPEGMANFKLLKMPAHK